MTSGDIYMLNRIFSTTGTLSGQLYFSLVSFFSSLFFSLSFSSLFFSLPFSSLFFSLSFSSFHFLLFCFFWLLNFFWLGTAFPKYTEFPGLHMRICGSDAEDKICMRIVGKKTRSKIEQNWGAGARARKNG